MFIRISLEYPYTNYSQLRLCMYLQLLYEGGPLVTRGNQDTDFRLVGIVKGGGVECSKLDNEGYSWEGKTGDWMRVAAFKDVWIDQVIEEDTRVGKEI